MASGSNDKSIRIWKYTDHHHNAGGKEDEEEDEGAGSLKVKLVVEGHSDDINHLAVSPDSKLIASASRDKTAKVLVFVFYNLKKKFSDSKQKTIFHHLLFFSVFISFFSYCTWSNVACIDVGATLHALMLEQRCMH